MSGSWTKLTATANVKDLEAVSSIMSMLDNGLMIEDYSDFSLNGMYGELVDDSILNADRETVRVSLFVPEHKSPAEYRAFLTERFCAEGIEAEISLEGLCEEDWADSWKQYYKPVHIGRVTVVPAWESYEAGVGETVIRMDPGMAFGTGTHETTRLVIRLMQEVVSGGERVLDVGTGSGILSICAVKLGAKFSAAYDIDPTAVKVARDNVAAEGCANITVEVSDLLRDVDTTGGGYDLCVANIVSDIIVRMMPDISKYLTTGASLILSGIINTRKEEVLASVAAAGFTVIKEAVENDWVALLCKSL